MTGTPAPKPNGRRNSSVALIVTGAALAMVGAAYGAVPLYYAFCRATGYGGTPQVASVAPDQLGRRNLTVRFDTNVGPGLPWAFSPDVPSVRLRTGETSTVYFRVTNRADHAVTAQAVFNVSPDQAGAWFDKINCFCFTEQTLAAGETAEMPVVFFLDPGLETDATMAKVDSLTLSYTFYATKSQDNAVAAAGSKARL